MREQRRLLAVGVDAAEAGLIRRLMSEGRLPTLKRLADQGRWSDVESNAGIGSAAVWPSFFTGREPYDHGQYGEWRWLPDRMDVERFSGRGLEPFWSHLSQAGLKVGVLDVPFAPLIGLKEGFEISEWGVHDVLEGHLSFGPEQISSVIRRLERHPYGSQPPLSEGPHDSEGLDLISEQSLDGIRLRGALADELIRTTEPDFVILVFPELHHAGHLMWHTAEGENRVYQSPERVYHQPQPSVPDLYEAMDAQIDRLQTTMGEGASVMLFALHGMAPARGVPTHVSALLKQAKLDIPATWRSMTWAERRSALIGALKRNAPAWIRDLYHRRAAQILQIKLARSTMLDRRDWSKTWAFDLPADIHGWIRINLKQRERDGIVDAADYDALVTEIEDAVRGIRSTEGRPLVSDTLRPFKGTIDPEYLLLPDLIVHWSEEAHVEGMHTEIPDLDTPRIAQHLTGRHTDSAFCISHGEISESMPESITTEAMHKAILDFFGVAPRAYP